MSIKAPGIIEKYFTELSVKSDTLDRISVWQLVLIVLRDFLDDKLSVDELTFVTTQIFYVISFRELQKVQIAGKIKNLLRDEKYRKNSKKIDTSKNRNK